MRKTFKEDLEIIRSGRVKEIVELEKALKKLGNCMCRGEVNLVDKKTNKPIIQTHYEYFTIIITEGLVKLTNCNTINGNETLDYTMLNNIVLTSYSVSDTNIILECDLSEIYKINILVVFKDKIKK